MQGKSNSTMMLLCVFCVLICGNANPALWNNMTSGVTYDIPFTPPSPPAGYERVKFHITDLFWERHT